jgi:hypothetical protein
VSAALGSILKESTMSRFTSVFTALSLSLFAHTAQADELKLTHGVSSILITSAVPDINLSVRNLSGSSLSEDRELVMVSAQPVVDVEAQVFCRQMSSGQNDLRSVELTFGASDVYIGANGYDVMEVGVWDGSEPLLYQGGLSSDEVYLEHQLDLPTTVNDGSWLAFNPAKVVEQRLQAYVNNGGTAADFLRQDDVFEVDISMNVVVWCEYQGTYVDVMYPGMRTRPVTVAIFYHGDPNIQDDPITTVGTIGTITTTPTPPPLTVTAPSPTRSTTTTTTTTTTRSR